MPLKLEIYLERMGTKQEGSTVDLGEFDIKYGYEGVFYLRNPNPHLKAYFTDSENRNSSVQIKLPTTIEPETMEPVYVKISSIEFQSIEEEQELFKDIYDNISGRIKWVPV